MRGVLTIAKRSHGRPRTVAGPPLPSQPVGFAAVAPRGAPGTDGEQGERGPSDAYADGPNFAPISRFGLTTAASLEVPAGSYVVSASLRLRNTEFGTASVQCDVDTTPEDASAFNSPYQTGVERDSRQTLSFTRTLTVASGGGGPTSDQPLLPRQLKRRWRFQTCHGRCDPPHRREGRHAGGPGPALRDSGPPAALGACSIFPGRAPCWWATSRPDGI